MNPHQDPSQVTYPTRGTSPSDSPHQSNKMDTTQSTPAQASPDIVITPITPATTGTPKRAHFAPNIQESSPPDSSPQDETTGTPSAMETESPRTSILDDQVSAHPGLLDFTFRPPDTPTYYICLHGICLQNKSPYPPYSATHTRPISSSLAQE
jgi:hypothetical protein